MKFGFAAIALAGVASAVFIGATSAEELRIGDGCLRYDASLPRVNNRMLRDPFFLIELQAKPDGGAFSGQMELHVTFWRESPTLRAALIKQTQLPEFKNCGRIDLESGLTAYSDNDASGCPIMDRTIYVPTQKNDQYGATKLECVDAVGIENCRISEVYSNGWKVDASFPKEAINQWRDISDAVEQFYIENFDDCGVK